MTSLKDRGLTRTLAATGIIEPRHRAIAVLDPAGLRVSDGRRWASSPHDHRPIGAMLDFCRAHNLGQLWIHPAADALLDWRAEAWHGFRPLGKEDTRDRPRFWSTVVRAGVYEQTALVRPAYELAPACWRLAADGRELLEALCRFRLSVGVPFAYSGGHTAMDLLRATHSGRGTLTLRTPPPDIPAPVLAHGGSIEPDLSWLRPLTAAERARRWLHCFDKNGAYIGACASLPIGDGEPCEVAHLRVLTAEPAELRLPGFWLLYGPDVRAVQPAGLPPVVSPRSVGPEDDVWVTTPTLRLLLELGLPPTAIERGIVWPEHHQHLQRWYKSLKDARDVLGDEARLGVPGAAMALRAVKRVYTRGIGWLGMRSPTWRTPDNPLARPDIPPMVRAAARANILRNLLRLDPADATPSPFALAIDAIYVVSDEEDPAAAVPAGLRIGTGLGQWKAQWARPIPLAEALPAIDSGRPGRFFRWLWTRESARDGEVAAAWPA